MKEIFHNLKWFFKLKAKTYIFCVLLLIFVSVTPVVPSKLLGLVIDDVAMGTLSETKLIWYVIGLISFPALTYLVNIFYHYTINKVGQDLSFALREQYITHLFEMDQEFFEKYSKGDLIARATNDLGSLTTFATTFLQNVIYYICLIVASFVMMLIINPILAVASCIIMPFAVFYLNKKRKKKREYYKLHQEIYANMTANVLESIEGVKTVRAYGAEDLDFAKTKKAIDADVNSWWYILKFEALFTPMFELVYTFAYFIAISLGSYMAVNSIITPGSLVTFLVYVGLFNTPLTGLASLLNQISTINIASNRFYEIMNEKPTIHDTDESIDVFDFKTIQFKNVSFRYPFDNFDIIKDITFDINKGETIGIVGPTGCGKSTLIRQLLREFNPSNGEILIDNIPIQDYKIDDVRSLVGYVPQDHILFRRSVDDNILIGNPKASKSAVDHAIGAAEFKKDLSMLPEGLNTMVAELGESLSGGQKQRLSIARALVKDPKILILDDSLSAVDALTETNIIAHLKETRADKTNIIVAHRFSAVATADKILVLQEGRITDIGTHKQLLSYDNWYKEQYLRQIKEGE